MAKWYLCFILLLLVTSLNVADETNSEEHWLQNIIPPNYVPSTYKTNISINWALDIKVIFTLSAKLMEFSVDVFIEASWKDDQLHIPSNSFFQLPVDTAKKLFRPYLEFENCKACSQLIINPDKHQYTLKQKSVLVRYRDSFYFTCIFDLSQYPFDVQICHMKIKQTIWRGHVNLSIDKENEKYSKIDKKTLVMPSEFNLKSIEVVPYECDSENLNNFCFSYKFTFERTILQHLLETFIPSILIVILSWVPFWLDVDVAAARVAIGQTSLLTLAGQFHSIQRNLPAVSTVKALDIWMFACISMAFAALLEFALSYHFEKKKKINNQVQPNIKINTFVKYKKAECSSGNKIHKQTIDSWAKIVFPLIFFTFNIIFWMYFLIKLIP